MAATTKILESGFNSATKTFHSLRPPIHLPPLEAPISVVDYVISLHASSPWPASTTALIDSATGQRIPYSDLLKRHRSLSYYLHDVLKLSPNDTALVICPNCIQVPIIYLALLSLGVVVSPGNPMSTESEIARIIELANPVISFATSSTARKLPKMRLGTIIVDSPEFQSMMTDHDFGAVQVQVNQSDVAAILYSSGTTGRSKGVMLTHRNLIGSVAAGRSVAAKRDSHAVWLYTTPISHMYVFSYFLKSAALMETVVVMPTFNLIAMLKAVENFGVTDAALAPPVVVAMLKSGLTEDYSLWSVKCLMCGGAPLRKDVITEIKKKFPTVEVIQGYGLTESAGSVARLLGAEESRKWGSVGRINGFLEAKIVDAGSNEALPPGEQGELWIRGPTIMKGYVADPEATPATLVSNGWLRTGDLCYFDDQGFLYVVDRVKELIKCKGFQVAPAELEQLLQSHPGIADAAVVPYPDEEAGQVPFAFVVKGAGSSNLDEVSVMEFVAKQVAPYKKIRRVAFVSSIPKSPSGKILRKDLKKMLSLDSLPLTSKPRL